MLDIISVTDISYLSPRKSALMSSAPTNCDPPLKAGTFDNAARLRRGSRGRMLTHHCTVKLDSLFWGVGVDTTPLPACIFPVFNRWRERKLRAAAPSSPRVPACLRPRATQIYSTGRVQWTMRGGERYSPRRCEGSV